MNEGPSIDDRIPDPVELKYRIHDALRPDPKSGPMFPRLTEEIFRSVAQNKWLHFGILPVIVNEDGDVLILSHKQTERVAADLRGVMGETLTFEEKDGSVTEVEQVDQALSRALSEELGLDDEDITKLGLTTRAHGAWDLVAFPRGTDEVALGIVVVLRANAEAAAKLVGGRSGFDPRNKEIEGVQFLRPEEIERLSRQSGDLGLRPGTGEIIRRALDLMTADFDPAEVHLPAPRKSGADTREEIRRLLL